MKLSNRAQKLIIYSLTLLAFLLRAYQLGAQSYWIDEAWTAYWAHFSFGEIWHLLRTTEPLPPFYHPSTIYWVKLVGDSEYALRFYSLVFGVMAVPLTYRVGKDLGDSRLGLLAALFMTVAPYQVWHSQEARMYSVLTAAAAMSVWGFINLWQRGGWRWWLVYVVGTVWAIMNHYHGLVLIGMQGLFVLLTWRRRWRSGRFMAWAGGLAAILLVCGSWLLVGGSLLLRYDNWIVQTPLWDTYIRSAIAYSVGELVPRSQAIPLTLVFAAVYVLGLIYVTRRSWGSWRGSEVLVLLLAFTIAPNVAAWIYGEIRTPVYFERYLIPVQIGFLLAVSAGVLAVADSLRKRLSWGGPVIAGLLTMLLLGISGWVLGHHYADPVYARPDWRQVAHTIQSFELQGDAVIITGDGGEKAFDIYYQGDLPVYIDFNSPVPPENQARQVMNNIAANHDRIWYSPYGVNIDPVLEGWLGTNAYPAWQSWLGRKRLALYGSGLGVTERLERLDATFTDLPGQTLTLESVTMPAGAVAAGDVLPLSLTWLATTDLEKDYKLSLRLGNGQGDVFTQSDWPPLAATGGTSTWTLNQSITDRRGLWLPPDIPPGDYDLQLVVYDPTSGRPLGQPATVRGLKVGPAQTVVPVEVLPLPNPVQQTLDGLELVGYALPESVRPGEEMWLWLYWQAADDRLPPPETTLRLSLTSEGETVSAEFPLVDSVGPLDSWQPGQVRRAVYHWRTSPRLPGNQAEVSAALLTEAGQIQAETTLASIELESRPRQFEAPPIAHQTAVFFENPPLIGLIGFDLTTSELAPGDDLRVTLYWQAEGEMENNYTVFVQLLNSDWQVVAQEDLQPQAGAAPTTTWLPGEILTDPHTLPLPGQLPAGDYRLITGMYEPATGKRMSISTGGDFVDLGTVTIR